MSNTVLDFGSWTNEFKEVAKSLHESEKWYRFLNSLYTKLSEYEIQKNRRNYNVADLEDWGKPGKPQGIAITSSSFGLFLSKLSNYDIVDYDGIKSITITAQQLEELNKVLNLTLKHAVHVKCAESSVTLKGNYISLNETMTEKITEIDVSNSCEKLFK
ncbi:uncharacterized protein CEXT_769451 [Caerostris extrusa]|uniref:Uncharacterized protein n=1 Tax=Caerostris extrusa TaxID=172846 RepID=A0AAV4PTZ5_CAEEX|nr:uncharacterized protein CEXT_769451 [Caerostris extrusa]